MPCRGDSCTFIMHELLKLIKLFVIEAYETKVDNPV